jgi:hypothetical protein
MFTQPQRVARAVDQFGQIIAVPLPTGGINARDSLASMPQSDAVDLINVLTDHFGLSLRSGYQWWAWDLPNNQSISTLMSYYPPTAGRSTVVKQRQDISDLPRAVPKADVTVSGQLFACTNLNIFDVTAGGGGPWTPQTGLGVVLGDFWTWRNFQNAGGAFLLACNNLGGYISYGGSGFSDGFSDGFTTGAAGFSRIVEGPSAGDIQGQNPDLFVYLTVWKKRVWFIEKASSRAWYLPVGQLTGAVTQFDFGPQFRHGGHLTALVSWTLDGGEGIDDYLVAVSSEGDVVIYKGYDPDSADTDPSAFQLHGIWYVGALPSGFRQVDPYGGDVYILSTLGVSLLSKLVSGLHLTEAPLGAVTEKINPLIAQYMRVAQGQPDWYLKFLPREEIFMIGLPQVVSSSGVGQLAYKVPQKAWHRLGQLPFVTWSNHDGLLFSGGDLMADSEAGGKVFLAFENSLDNVAPEGETSTPRTITADVIPAYSGMGSPGLFKSFPMVRPSLLVDAIPSVKLAVLTDFRPRQYISEPTLPSNAAARWDEGLWDVGVWGGGGIPIRKWLGTTGAGFAATVQINIAGLGATRLTSCDWLIKVGGPL